MAKSKKTAPVEKPATGRASPEAVKKRRSARKLNELFSGKGSPAGKPIDGRSDRRRKRLLKELAEGTKQGARKPLKAIDVLHHIEELLGLGESLKNVRTHVKVRKNRALDGENGAEALREVHEAHKFRVEAYRFLGVSRETLVAAGIVASDAPKRGRKKKAA